MSPTHCLCGNSIPTGVLRLNVPARSSHRREPFHQIVKLKQPIGIGAYGGKHGKDCCNSNLRAASMVRTSNAVAAAVCTASLLLCSSFTRGCIPPAFVTCAPPHVCNDGVEMIQQESTALATREGEHGLSLHERGEYGLSLHESGKECCLDDTIGIERQIVKRSGSCLLCCLMPQRQKFDQCRHSRS